MRIVCWTNLQTGLYLNHSQKGNFEPRYGSDFCQKLHSIPVMSYHYFLLPLPLFFYAISCTLSLLCSSFILSHYRIPQSHEMLGHFSSETHHCQKSNIYKLSMEKYEYRLHICSHTYTDNSLVRKVFRCRFGCNR